MIITLHERRGRHSTSDIYISAETVSEVLAENVGILDECVLVGACGHELVAPASLSCVVDLIRDPFNNDSVNRVILVRQSRGIDNLSNAFSLS